MKIDTGRHIIRNFSFEDVAQFYEIAHEEKVEKYVPYAYCQNLEDAEDLMKYYSQGDCIRDFYLAICKEKKIVGAIIAVQMDVGKLDCSVLVSNKCRGQGIMQDAIPAFVSWLKENSNSILELDLTIEKDNLSSIRLAQKLNAEKIQSTSQRAYHYRILIHQ